MLLSFPIDESVRVRLQQSPQRLIVTCLCAAWCNTCTEYQLKFNALAQRHSDLFFIWLDIEEHEDLLGDFDIENFPTLLIQNHQQTYFYGTMLPHIEHLDKLLHVVDAQTAIPTNQAPQVYTYLLNT